jgi:hypothetical protein
MIKNKIKVKRIDTLIWPSTCPNCGRSMRVSDIVGYDLKIKKNLKVLFSAGLGPKRLNVKICAACAGKISKLKTLETAGSILLFASIMGVIFLQRKEMVLLYIGGAAFWLGIIMMAATEFFSQKLIGVECRLLGKNNWEIKLQNGLFYKEFQSLNLKYVAENS